MTDPTAPTTDRPAPWVVPVPDDQALLAAMYEAHELLGNLAYANADETPADERWTLPAAVGTQAHEAYDRLSDALILQLTPAHERDTDAETARGELYGATTTGLMPLRLVSVDPADVALAAEALRTCQRALDPEARKAAEGAEREQLLQLADLLDQLTYGRGHDSADDVRDALIAPLALVIGVLQLEQDDDVRTLVDALRGRTGDVTLTMAQEAAYRRYARRLVTVLTLHQPHHERALTYSSYAGF